MKKIYSNKNPTSDPTRGFHCVWLVYFWAGAVAARVRLVAVMMLQCTQLESAARLQQLQPRSILAERSDRLLS